MQTRYTFDHGGNGGHTPTTDRHISVLTRYSMVIRTLACVGAMCLSLSACTAPRIDGRAEAEQQPSACETAYYAAESYTAIMTGTSPNAMRYLAAKNAVDQWNNVAGYCTQRFAQGTIRAAQAEYVAASLGTSLGQSVSLSHAQLDGVTHLDLDAHALGSMALAEDRAGFVTEILAARKVTNANLSVSDEHKTTGQLLFSLSQTSKDPREKVYDVRGILAHPEMMTDSATGLTAPTIAVAEITCAREEIDAISDTSRSADTNATSTDTSGNTGNTKTSDVNANATDTDTTNTNSATLLSNESSEHAQTLRTLAALVSSRIAHAFSYGYPSFDHALFQ